MRLEAGIGHDTLHARVADAHFSAIDRTLQCLALAGRCFSFTVFSTTLSFIAALSGVRPGGLERPFDQTIDAGLGKIVLSALTHNRHDREPALARLV